MAVTQIFKRLYGLVIKPAARYPADPRAVFILALSVFSGITAVALQSGPPSLEAILPMWAVISWGLLLTAGSITTLVGMYFQSVNGIIAEQIGSAIVAAATIFYSGLAFYQIGWGALQGVGIILAWGLSCILRYFQLRSLIRNAIARATKLELLARVNAEIEAHMTRDRAEREMRRVTQ